MDTNLITRTIEVLNPECRSSRVMASGTDPAAQYDSATVTKLKWLFMDCAQKICPGFRITEEQKPLIAAIFNWCIGLPGRLDPSRGLWLHGDIGSGKTTMLKIVRLFCRYVRQGMVEGFPYSFGISNAIEVCGKYAKSGYEGLEPYISTPCLAFDEVGSESRVIAHYGSVENVMQYILQRRYDRRFESTTHVTTNFTVEDIGRLYGPRIFDRCREMFNFVEYHGRSFRKDLERRI